jgi:serine/threonine-protein kinase
MRICPECHATYPEGTSACAEDGTPLVDVDDFDADPPLEPGAMVGEYRVDRRLGSGTFGDVYAGEQPLIGKKVAIKVLRHKFSADPQVVSRFISEARAVNKIRHRNIIDIFSFGRLPDRRHYFVMELLDGLTLGELLRRERRLPIPQALEILRGIADALDAAHEAGVTHRDLKPDNIFLAVEKDDAYFPKLLDFGVAKLVSDEIAHKTATGAAIGTPRYMAPEQARGKPVDHRADIYALGVVIHEMLTGTLLFEGDTAMDVLLKHTVEPPPSMSSVCPEIPKDLDAPVLAMLAKRKEARPNSAGEAVAALAERARAAMDTATLTIRPRPVGEAMEKALARVEEATVREAKPPPTRGETEPSTRRAVVPAPSTLKSEGPLTPADELGETMLQPSSADPRRTPESRTVAATRPIEPRAAEAKSADAETPKKGGLPWIPIAAAGAAVGVIAIGLRFLGGGGVATPVPATATASASARALPEEITLRFSVSPADADVLLDDRRVGSAADPLSIPRSDRKRAIRFEKPGYLGTTVWITADRDQELGPLELARAQAAATPAPAPTPSIKPPAPSIHGDLDRPDTYKKQR